MLATYKRVSLPAGSLHSSIIAWADLADQPRMERLFAEEPFDCVIHLAAQAGVRYSLMNPLAYIVSDM